jgi:enoyl-CoA hydratase
MDETLLVNRNGDGILSVVLNRPERHNALDFNLLERLATTIREMGEDAAVVILRGAGEKAFSSGFDVTELTGSVQDMRADEAVGRAADAIRSCPVPVIARLRGHCHGAGIDIALACDLRIAADDVHLSLPAVRLGVVYRYQLLGRLAQMAGLGRAQDLLLAMPTLDAQQALSWGLLSEVMAADGLDGRIAAIASALAAAPPPAVRGTKASLRLLSERIVDVSDLAEAERWRRIAAQSPERREALNATRQRLGLEPV